MNTYGKIILENGQKVFKRFGAATKQKIKLGTAAFADIVKSTSVTQEGSVPDAILVAQQQQLIGQQQETIANLQQQVDSLNSETIVEINTVASYISSMPKCYVQNKICIISGTIVFTKETGGAIEVLGNALPKPSHLYGSGWIFGIAFQSGSGVLYRIGVRNNGDLCSVWTSIPAGAYDVSPFAYIIE